MSGWRHFLRHASLLRGPFLTALTVLVAVSPAQPSVFAGEGPVQPADRLAWRRALGIAEEAILPGTEVGNAVLQVSRFTDSRDVATLVEQVRHAWMEEGSRVMQSRRDEWTLLTRSVGASVETVEVRSATLRSEGRIIGATTRPSSDRDPSGDWLRAALADAAEPEPAVTHRDAGRVLTTRVALTAATVEHAISALADELRRNGFRLVSPAAPARERTDRADRRGWALLMSRRGEEVALSVSEHGSRRAVVLHWGRGS